MKNNENYTEHTISLIVKNNPGVMARVSGLINRRGFNVESITVGKTKEKGFARITIVIKGDDRSIEQIQKQLFKMIDTVTIFPIAVQDRVAREIGLIKIKLTKGDKGELFQLINIYKAEIVDTSPGAIIVELTGPSEKIDGFIDLIPHNLVVGVARSGVVALDRLKKSMTN